jgi:hypothetical protein
MLWPTNPKGLGEWAVQIQAAEFASIVEHLDDLILVLEYEADLRL